jgi:hypothetical protein
LFISDLKNLFCLKEPNEEEARNMKICEYSYSADGKLTGIAYTKDRKTNRNKKIRRTEVKKENMNH